MGIIVAIGVIAMSILGAALSQQLTDEFKAWTPKLVELLIRRAVRGSPAENQDRLNEEWHAHTDEIPGQIGKLFVAIGFVIASVEIPRRASRKAKRRSARTVSNYERETGRVELACLPEVWPFPSRELQTPFLRATKRVFDIIVSLIAIAATAPVMVLTALAIRMED